MRRAIVSTIAITFVFGLWTAHRTAASDNVKNSGEVSIVKLGKGNVVEFVDGIDFARFATFSCIDAEKADPLVDGLQEEIQTALALRGLKQRASGADLHVHALGYRSTEVGGAFPEDVFPSGQHRTTPPQNPSLGTLDDMNWKMAKQPSTTGSAAFFHLHIDFVDPTTNETVWRATGVAKMRSRNPEKNRLVMRKLVNKLFRGFPPR